MIQVAANKAANMPAHNHINTKCEASSISVGSISQIGRKANLLSDLVSLQTLQKHFRKRNDFFSDLHNAAKQARDVFIPSVPHKAVAEVSKKRKPIGEAGCCESWMAEGIH